MKFELKSGCAICSPHCFEMIFTIFAAKRLIFVRAYVKAALVKTGKASRDVYVCLPCEFKDRCYYLLIISVAYDLLDSNFMF